MSHPAPLVPDTSRQDWSAAQLRSLPDDGIRYEVVDGALLMTPAPSERHQDAVLELAVRLKPYADAWQLHLFVAPTAVRFSSKREVQPDLLVLPAVDGRRARHVGDVDHLALVVEVLSPTTARADRDVKRRLYADEAVPEYWVVDVESRSVERWRPSNDRPDVLRDTVIWQPAADAAPLHLDLPDYFRAVHAE